MALRARWKHSTFMHFFSIHTHRCGRTDAQANPISMYSIDDDPDFRVNHDRLSDTPSEY